MQNTLLPKIYGHKARTTIKFSTMGQQSCYPCRQCYLLPNAIMDQQPYNPLHGITLQTIVTELVEHFGFDELGKHINIRCFTHDPSIKSSLKFLRKTPWAREKVEQFYIKNKSKLHA